MVKSPPVSSNVKIPVAVISDGKPGHENQSIGIAEHIPGSEIILLRHNLKESFSEGLFRLRLRIFGSSVRGAVPLLRFAFDDSEIDRLNKHSPKAIISAGTLSAGLNFLAGKLTGAKTCVIMQPSMLPLDMFDLAIIPEHDNPIDSPKIVKTLAAPNRVSEKFLSEEADKWWSELPTGPKVISWIIGGPSGSADFDEKHVLGGLLETLVWAGQRGWQVWLSTARRTPETLEEGISRIIKGYPSLTYALLWHTDHRNPLYAMFERSKVAVVTSDSVSMIAEAASAGKGPIVYRASVSGKRKGNVTKQDRMVERLIAEGYGMRVNDPDELTAQLSIVVKRQEEFPRLDDTNRAAERLVGVIS